MCSDVVIKVRKLSKCFQIYEQPRDRLKQMLLPRFQPLIGQSPKQYFREFWALEELSFDVTRGETVGIIGRNGSGKSTLLQMLCGTLTPTSGEVEITGRVAALLELGSGFNPEFTGRENVYMNASVLGLSNTEVDRRFEDIVAFSEIGEFIDQPVKTYSSGMMVRLAFSVIAHVDADILIIDEALAVGDAFFTQKCMRFLRKFMKHGTVLFVSHDTTAVRNLCNRALWLDNGRLLMEGAPKDISEKYLEAFYESQQGKGLKLKKASDKQNNPSRPFKDQRDEFINQSNLRNDIEIFQFDQDALGFGTGKAQVTNVQFTDSEGSILSWVVGGEDVVLQVEAKSQVQMQSPIIGFFVKDKLGQEVFGDNTYLSFYDDPVQCGADARLVAEFKFQMPRLASGHYSITVAIADGNQVEHIQHHWIHDAITFRSEATSVVSGTVGIPMKEIDLKAHND
ncbi:ABC transporter ATP-binding protein [Marinobacter arenosus]|uniref:ABC transporter ATP-binding protein n=1 Tax=Marinobacter arenosus TaxID=2856822 RepID=UPI001E4A2D16|nr:ABC transporter ATP-binding protein [Marinobacter arenosus]